MAKILWQLILSTFLPWLILAQTTAQTEAVNDFFRQDGGRGHTNNWAVLVCSSRYWFNYRHMANTLGMYRTVKRLGIPDSNIILMLADDVSCNARNKFPATVYPNSRRSIDLYGENIEVDYRGYEVTVENFLRLLTGRVDPTLPRSKRLMTDEKSNIFVYMTGHGGAEFLKFQDNEEISAFDIADAFEQMWQKKRYHEIFFMIDTCQANTMYSKFYSPNILATGSSELGESSYSYENDADIGVAVIDRYTHLVLQYLEGINKTSQATMQQLFDAYDFNHVRSHAGVRTDLFHRDPSKVLLTDFFGGVAQTDVVAPIDVDDAKIFASNFAEQLVAGTSNKTTVASSSSAAGATSTESSRSSDSNVRSGGGTNQPLGSTQKAKAADYHSTAIKAETDTDFSGTVVTEPGWFSISQSTLRAGAAIGLLFGTVAVTKAFS